MPQTAQTLNTTVTQQVDLGYLLYLPPDYDSQEQWPLILFLHGMGERGSDLELLKLHGLPRRLAAGDDFPFIIASPQCPITSVWPEQITPLGALLDHLLANYNIDAKRVYLTGLSMGGYGTWYLAASTPERFAAIAPICGGGIRWMGQRLKDTPAWVFHGDADDVVSLSESEKMVKALEVAGGDVKFTVYPDVGHDSWTKTYDNPELYEWFLHHSRP